MSLTLLEIRNKIELALGDLIGTYHLPKGNKSIPAIAIVPDPNLGYNYPPETTRTEGLEVIIMFGNPDIETLLSRQALINKTIRIMLKQWDFTKTTIPALEAIAPLYELEMKPTRAIASEKTQCEVTVITIANRCVVHA